MSLAPLNLVSAHAWERATFTTYALSLSFFEAVILDALIRGRARQALVLADVQGIRASLSEQGAQRVGKDYNVEPVAVSSGYAFHPKISVLSDKDECHVLVGSGNLTFHGWGETSRSWNTCIRALPPTRSSILRNSSTCSRSPSACVLAPATIAP
jgi:hypothetical protein